MGIAEAMGQKSLLLLFPIIKKTSIALQQPAGSMFFTRIN